MLSKNNKLNSSSKIGSVNSSSRDNNHAMSQTMENLSHHLSGTKSGDTPRQSPGNASSVQGALDVTMERHLRLQ